MSVRWVYAYAVGLGFLATTAGAYEVEVHKEMSRGASRQSFGNLTHPDVLLRLGIFPQRTVNKKTPLEWIVNGSDWEDCCIRPVNHFYDPTTGRGLLNLSEFIATDAVNWALEQRAVGTLTQKWSLRDAREYYYHGLTDPDPQDRDENLAKTFRALGNVIHLIQDMAQPQHVRDDVHLKTGIPILEWILDWDHSRYEEYTNQNVGELRYTGYAPVNLPNAISYWDGDDGRGLAEVTNQNFFSERKITCSGAVCTEFPYSSPAINSNDGYEATETIQYNDGSTQSGEFTFFSHGFVDPITGETVTNSRALSYSLFDRDLLSRGANPRYLQNRFTFEKSQEILVPRAVGYSAGFINQFFRNDIEITPPDRFVYGITSAAGTFPEIRLKARNITTTGGALSGGTIQLVLTYRQALEDPYRANLGGPVPTSAEATTIVVPVANPVTNIPSDVPVELVFNLSNTPLPRLITDLYAQVVYRGAWGTETDAVVVGYKDLSEPTPIDVINAMDYVCLNGQYPVAGSAEAVAAGDLDHDGVIELGEPDVFGHGLENVLVRFSSAQAPEPASDANYTVRMSAIQRAQYGRMVVLVEPDFSFSARSRYVREDTRDPSAHVGAQTFTTPMRGVKNQREVVNGQDTTFFSVLSDMRTLPIWFGVPYFNNEYPLNTICAESAIRGATPALTGPVPMEIR